MKSKEEHHISQMKKGDYNSFRYLYDKYSSMLFGFSLNLTRSKQDANILVQDTFIKVWINRESIDPNLSFKSFLFRVAKNHLIDEFRKKLRSPHFEEYLFQNANTGLSHNPIEDKSDYDDFLFKLNTAKQMLSSRQRQIFELSKEQGFSVQEVAKQLALSEQTVYNQLHLAIQALRKEIKHHLSIFAIFLYIT